MLCGTKYFGYEVAIALSNIGGVNVKWISTPVGDRCELASIKIGAEIIRGAKESDMPEGVDLIVTAHSHDFISEKARLRSTYGGIGYHPSLLPIHRGRDAVKWAVKMGDKVTGGTVYRLSNKVDGGNILEQKHVFINKDDSASKLWRDKLCPMGIKMLCDVVEMFRDNGYISGDEQDDELSTFEPSMECQPIHRPDLLMLPEAKSNG